MSSVNRIIIIGRLGRDPELTLSKNNLELVKFSLSNDVRSKDGTEKTQWHNVRVFGKQASTCNSYLRKGDLCCVEGRVEARPFEHKGEKRVSHSVIAERVTFLGKSRRRREEDAETQKQVELELSL